MPRTRTKVLEERERLKAQYGELFEAAAALLFRHDPIGINATDNTDEYEPEVGTILPRLRMCRDEADVRRVVHEEFVCWFDARTAGPPEHYERIAAELWQLHQRVAAA
jgi:hypothetical protein